jgi:hypothetical protein
MQAFAKAEGTPMKRQHAISGAFCHRSFANGRAASAFATEPAFAAERFI